MVNIACANELIYVLNVLIYELNICNLQPTHPQGLVSQVDRKVLVIHLYHLDLKFKWHNLQGCVNCQVSIYSPF